MNTFMFSIDPEWGHMATTMSMVAFKDGILYPNGAEEHKPVFIGNDVFIGANVTILDGVTIVFGTGG